MNIFDTMASLGHEQVILCRDDEAGYRAVIAIHSTTLGPAVGGTRFWRYASEGDALVDALRLSRGMTYKCAAADLPLGGGKSVILDPRGEREPFDRERLFRAHGRFVDRLGGRYVTAEDVGTTPADMATIHQETAHVAGLPTRAGDPTPLTALGVFQAMRAAAEHRWGSADLAGRTVAIQGCGNVGAHLAELLVQAGARLILTDLDRDRLTRLARTLGAETREPDGIYDAEADIFSPCALGGILDDVTIPRLRAAIVAGGANNQLLEPRHGDALEARGILYAPDYVANAGGVISGTVDLLGWDADRARRTVEQIYDTMRRVLGTARDGRIPPSRAADRLAEERLRTARQRASRAWTRET